MQFSIKDSFRSAIETASGGRNTVMYDEQGNPNIMVCFTKVDCSFFGANKFGSGTHPAFIINGKEVDEIWIGKYMNADAGDVDISMPNMRPSHHTENKNGFSAVNPLLYFSERAKRKGPGWHMQSNAERALIELWMMLLGSYKGGSADINIGSDYPHKVIPYKSTTAIGGLTDDGQVYTYTDSYGGSSSKLTSHDNTEFGVYDVTGSAWEYVTGFEVYGQRVFFHGEDGVPDNGCFAKDLLYKPNSKEWIVGPYFTFSSGNAGAVQVNDEPPRTKVDAISIHASDIGSHGNPDANNYMAQYMTRLSIYHLNADAIGGTDEDLSHIWYFINGFPYEESNHYGVARGCRTGDTVNNWSPFSWYSRACGKYFEPVGCYTSRLVWVSPDKL